MSAPAAPIWDLSLLERFLIAGRALWFYLGKLAWPTRLTFSYPRWQIDVGLWWQYVFPLATVAVTAGLYVLRKRIGRGPLVAALLFGGTLVPALGFIDVYPMRYSFVADHFQYLAGIAPVALVIVWLRGMTRTRREDGADHSVRLTVLRAAVGRGARNAGGPNVAPVWHLQKPGHLVARHAGQKPSFMDGSQQPRCPAQRAGALGRGRASL